VFETTQVTKEKVDQVKGHDGSTLGTSDEKPHKDDEAGKDDVQYDAIQEEYDSGVGSILEQLKQKIVEFFRTM
jgi:hypothetical protein